MSYFHTCPGCGANLDPGEVCDCKRKAAPSVTSTESGRRNKFDTTLFPPPMIPKIKEEIKYEC